MSASLTGTRILTRFALRRDKIMLPVWVYIVVIEIVVNAATFTKLYKTAAQRASLAATGRDNPALVFLYGRLYSDSVGGLTFWRIGVWASMFAALMTIFLVIRHTRADEETGRLELIGSARVGRYAPLVSAITVAVTANVVVIILLALILPVFKLPAAGSVAFALVVG